MNGKGGGKSIYQSHIFNSHAIIVCQINESLSVLSHEQKDTLVFWLQNKSTATLWRTG